MQNLLVLSAVLAGTAPLDSGGEHTRGQSDLIRIDIVSHCSRPEAFNPKGQ